MAGSISITPAFEALATKCGPYWAGEAEVARVYFASPGRTAESDRTWLARQCYKEFFGSGFVDPKLGLIGEWGQKAIDSIPRIDEGVDRYEILDLLEGATTEFAHYCLFADVYDALTPDGAPKLNPRMLSNWPEGEALDNFRAVTRTRYPTVGWAALRFTEGGYCTLYAEGAKLADRDGVDGMIGRACRQVYDDEVGHLVKGMVAIAADVASDADWALLDELVIEQLRRRIHMRNGQFGFPLSEKRLAGILAGDIEPIRFDYDAVSAL